MTGLAKITQLSAQKNKLKKTFSLADIKTQYFNELLLDLFLIKYQIDPNIEKIKVFIKN